MPRWIPTRYRLLWVLILGVIGLPSFTAARLPSMPLSTPQAPVRSERVLMFVAYDQVWWAEYKILYEALQAQGYVVDVRSSAAGVAHSYGDAIDAVPGAPASYDEFRTLFTANFGVPWDSAWNTPQTIPLAGRIQDVPSLAEYAAIVIPGGVGVNAYRYDGTYNGLGPVGHHTTAAEVQAAAEHLNALMVEALQTGKPIGAQCHGAALPVFARIPGSAGGPDGLGESVLAGRYATGYPGNDGDTAASFATMGVQYLGAEKLVIDGPDPVDLPNSYGRDAIITSADWFPHTVAYHARTLLTMLETYPSPAQREEPISILIFGGDEPTNYPPQQPARYTDLVTLLNDPSDEFSFNATGTNQESDLNLTNLNQYDVVVYFRHDRISQSAQEAVRAYSDGGGGVVALHHAIYNEGAMKGTLIDLIGGELPLGVSLHSELGLVYSNESNHMINVNLGHFVSTYGVHLLPGDPIQTVHYETPLGIPNSNLDGNATAGYYHFRIPASDELYLGNRFNSDVTFGSGINQINRLFANDRFVSGSPNPNNGQYDTWGWTKRYDGDGDGVAGRLVYLQPGETADRTLNHPAYRQTIKNAVLWSSNVAPQHTVFTPAVLNP